MREVTITIERYEELLRKETLFDLRQLLMKKDITLFSDTEKVLFGVEEEE